MFEVTMVYRIEIAEGFDRQQNDYSYRPAA